MKNLHYHFNRHAKSKTPYQSGFQRTHGFVSVSIWEVDTYWRKKKNLLTVSIISHPPSLSKKAEHVKTVNITFSKLVKLDNRQWEVNFRKLPSVPYQFHADTATLQGDRIQFNIYRDGNSGWKISGRDLPPIFISQCDKLGTAIEKGLEEYYPGYSE
jgi:hypothetical protein